MMRVLEFIVAFVIVAVLGVVVGVILPSTGHVERSLVFGKDLRQVYDILDNFHRFPDYSVLGSYDPNLKYELSGPAFGPGAAISWSSKDAKVGDGKLTIASAQPDFNKVDTTARGGQIVWNLDNDWRGQDKHFTLAMARQGSRGQLTKVTWSYNVAYGFNLVDRYSNLYIHGNPDAFIQFSLGNLQSVLAGVPNINYSNLVPYIVQTQPTPMLLVSTSIERSGGLVALDDATATAEKEIQDAAKKLGVKVTGPRVIFTTNYGDQNYTFDVAMPIDASSLTIDKQSYDLTAPQPPKLDSMGQPAESASIADASSVANASSVAAASSSASPASSAAAAASTAPGSRDRFGRLIVDGNVRAELAFGGPALMAPWTGTAAGVPLTRDMLKAYSATHGYKYDDVVHRMYDILVQPEVRDDKGNITTYSRFEVYLPLGDNAPEHTPEQAAGIPQVTLEVPAPASSAPAGSSSVPAPAGTADAPASAASVIE